MPNFTADGVPESSRGRLSHSDPCRACHGGQTHIARIIMQTKVPRAKQLDSTKLQVPA